MGIYTPPAQAHSIIDDSHLYGAIDQQGVFGGLTDNMTLDNGPWGYIDRTGKFAVNASYDQAGYFKNGQARVKRGRSFNTIDKKGKEKLIGKDMLLSRPVRPGNPNADRNIGKELVAKKNKNGKWEIFDKSYKRRASGLDNILWFEDNDLVPAEASEKWGYLDKNGKFVIAPQFEDAWPFFEGLACVSVNGKYGFINPSGKLVIQPQFYIPTRFSDGLAPMKAHLDENKIAEYYQRYRQNSCWFVDKFGHRIGNLEFGAARPFSEGLASVRSDIRWGFITTKGEYQIKPIYQQAYHFSNARCAVKLNGRWGFIDPTGKMVVPTIYLAVSNFSDASAPVINKDGKLKYIDLNGKVLANVHRQKNKIEEEMANASEELAQSCGVSPDPRGGVSLTNDYLWRTKLMHGNIEEDYIPISLLNPNFWYEQQSAYEEDLPPLKGASIQHSESEGPYPDCDNTLPVAKQWGYRESPLNGKFVIKPQFCWAGTFHEGLARVLLNRGSWSSKPAWGFVDRNGKIILTLKHDQVGSFYNGCALVSDDNMDASSNMVYDYIRGLLGQHQ